MSRLGRLLAELGSSDIHRRSVRSAIPHCFAAAAILVADRSAPWRLARKSWA